MAAWLACRGSVEMQFEALCHCLGVGSGFDGEDHLDVGTLRKGLVGDEDVGVLFLAFRERKFGRCGALDAGEAIIGAGGVIVRFRTIRALANPATEEPRMDQKDENDAAGGTNAPGASASPGETESQGFYSTRSRLCGQARTFRLLRKVAVDAARDDVAGGFVEIVVEQLGEFEKLRP